jgi:hypothetical protein|nr:MAG TPA: Protein of unknown function (DUF3789) [Caudoviricetes sp.]
MELTYFICGMIAGGGITLIVYSILVAKRIQEEQDKATKCIFKYEKYRRRIRTLKYQNKELEKRIIELQTKYGEVVTSVDFWDVNDDGVKENV